MSGNNKNSKRMSPFVLLVVLLIGVCSLTLVSARYLPTRSDNTRRERIKDVLRLVSNEGRASNTFIVRTLFGIVTNLLLVCVSCLSFFPAA